MFDFSWSEILLIAVVALVVIGPKDLPRALRTAGLWAGRARSVAREFQTQIDQMVRDSELDDVRKAMNAATNPEHMIRNVVDPTGEIESSVSTPEMLGQTSHSAAPESSATALPAPETEPSASAGPVGETPFPVIVSPVPASAPADSAAATLAEPKSEIPADRT
jgi:sec-independent protein translocase protein TatB